MGILTILFNRQIMTYLGTNALSIYGVIVNVSTFVQCCAYSVGQASQPIFSTNYGAGKWKRVKETLKYALYTAAFFAILWTVLCLTIPNQFIHIFMTPTKQVLEIAPSIISTYGLSFLLLPINIFSTHYFQAIMKPNVAFIDSVARGLVISGLLIYILPIVFSAGALWFAMPLTELIVAVYAIYMMVKFTKEFMLRKKKATI